MSDATRDDWKSKLKRFFWIAVAVVLVIWALVAASQGREAARAAQATLATPEFEYDFVVGGPQRFPDGFDAVDNLESDAELPVDQFLWSTIVLTNVSEGDATDFRMVVDTVDQPDHVLVAPAGYGTQLEIGTTDEEGLPEISLSSFDSSDTAYVFLAFSPEDVSAPFESSILEQWAGTYDLQLEQLTIDTDEGNTKTHYGKGFAAYLTG